MPISPDYQAALATWKELLDPQQIITEASVLSAAGRSTFKTPGNIVAILQPSSREEIQGIVRSAARHHVPLHVISRGRNIGYGSRAPSRPRCVLLDLSAMNRILEFNEKLAYVTVEPGVTFQQLHEFLSAKESNLFMAGIGGPPDASLIGNAVERGDGTGPNGDIFAHVTDFEVILADGTCLNPGLRRFGHTVTPPVSRWGLGPYVDGLFTQSGLGIVTRMTFWLSPKPAGYQKFRGTIEHDHQLAELVDGCRQLLLEQTIRSGVFIWNNYKGLSVLSQYPWKETGGRTPLPPELLAKLCSSSHLSRWMLTAALYSPSIIQARADRLRVRQILGPRTQRLEFRSLPRDHRTSSGTGPDPFMGDPSSRNLNTLYWRKKIPPPRFPKPEADGCGFIWCTAGVPFDGGLTRDAVHRVEELFLGSGFEPGIALIGQSSRLLYLVAALIFDRDIPGEDERALNCYRSFNRVMADLGYVPFRQGILPADSLPPVDEEYLRFRQVLRDALDPTGILPPDR